MRDPDSLEAVGRREMDAEQLADRLHAARLAALLGRAGPEKPPPRDALEMLIQRTGEVFAHSITAETRATYAHRWVLFERWCIDKGESPLPASPEVVMLYLLETSADGVSLSTLRGWMAALNRVHLEAGYVPPGDDPAMTMFLRGLSRSAPRDSGGKISALRVAQLRQVCRVLATQSLVPVQVRDRAILVLHRAGLTDGAVARLRWSDVSITDKVAVVRVGSCRKGCPERRVTLRRRRTAVACPVAALSLWGEVAGNGTDFVFSGVDAFGHRTSRPLTAKSVYSVRHSRVRSMGVLHTVDEAIELLGHAPPEVTRDKALLLLGFAGAFRRVELTRLRWKNIVATSEGLVLHLDRSKTDRAGRGQDVGIPSGKSELTCPVTALAAWRASYQRAHGSESITDLPVFVRVGRSGRFDAGPLSPEAITRVVQRRANQADLEGRWGGRSLRAGFITTAADLDIPLERIARQSRHSTLDTLMLYIRTDDPFRRNAASSVGL